MKKPGRSIEQRVLEMLDAIADLRTFVVGRTAAELDQDKMFLRAVLNAVRQIGEAGKFVPDDLRAEYGAEIG